MQNDAILFAIDISPPMLQKAPKIDTPKADTDNPSVAAL